MGWLQRKQNRHSVGLTPALNEFMFKQQFLDNDIEPEVKLERRILHLDFNVEFYVGIKLLTKQHDRDWNNAVANITSIKNPIWKLKLYYWQKRTVLQPPTPFKAMNAEELFNWNSVYHLSPRYYSCLYPNRDKEWA